MLEGREIEGKVGDVGEYFLDADEKGNIEVALNVEQDFGFGKAKSANSVNLNILDAAEMVAKKTKTTLDDSAVATLKALLGIVDEKPAEEPAPSEPPPAS